MAGKVIFISYRRDDDPAAAARVRDGLARKFGNANLFIDVDDLLAGQRFDEELAKALSVSNVLIAIIGSRWMELLKAKHANSQRDYVREEIAAALQRRIVVIPVRVGREGQLPPLPPAGDLPSDISDLILYQKHDVTHERFGRDIAELVEAIKVVRRSGLTTPQRWRGIGIMVGVCTLAMAYLGADYAGLPVPRPGSPEAVSNPITNQSGTAADLSAKAEVDRKPNGQAARGEGGVSAAEPAGVTEAKEQLIELGQMAQAMAKQKHVDVYREPAFLVKPGSGKSFRDQLANGQPCRFCPEMVVAPAGSFMMGSPASEPKRNDGEVQVPVTIAQPFAVGKFAVTFDQWDACVADRGCNGYRPDDDGWGRGSRPVIHVNWDDAQAYVTWLSRKTGKIYRLLSEAEREYVTRANTATPFWWGSSIMPTQANYNTIFTYAGGAQGEYEPQTVPVDSFDANPWGLLNVHGNVWEWTQDCWNESNQGHPGNGTERKAGDCKRRVIRGGAWNDAPQQLRAADRNSSTVLRRGNDLGFRLARTLNP
jgi:formylglycine-generating enzyme required for sulfatase activity